MLKEQVDYVVVTSFRSPQDWGGNGITAFRVDVRSGRNEEMAECVMIIDSCPLQLMSVSAIHSLYF